MTASSKWFVTALTAGILYSWLGSPASAAAFGVNPVADTFVTTGPGGSLSGQNYGAGGALGVSAPGMPKGEFQSVLNFNLAGARDSFNSQFGAGQWTVGSASLQLTATPPNNALFNATGAGKFSIYWMQNDSWTEGTGTPNAPATSGLTFTSLNSSFIGAVDENLGTFSYDGTTSGAANFTLNLTPGFTADLLAGNNVSLRLAAADGGISYLFDSRTFGTAAARPLFTITGVPEPGTTALCILGIACLAGRGVMNRRKAL